MTSLALPQPQPSAARQALDILRSHPRESAGAGLLMLAAAASIAAVANPSDAVPLRPEAQAAATPAVQELTPFAVREVAAGEAQKLNAAVPVASGPNPAATPFVLQGDRKTYSRALECLTQAIYYEAARESTDGQRAVAQVVLNRMRHPAYPASVCAVVYQGAERPTGCQFSFTCDGSLYRQPMRSYWDRASRVAQAALAGYVHAPVGNATHYHTDYVMPYWAPTLVKNAVVGTHIFYRWPGGWGRPTAFTQKWVKREADPRLLRNAALVAEARHDAADSALAKAALPADEQEIVVEAKRKLPPELATLVEAELGAKGETRVGMTIPQPRRDPAAKIPSSPSLDWALTGKGAEQAPLGSKPAPAAPPPAAK